MKSCSLCFALRKMGIDFWANENKKIFHIYIRHSKLLFLLDVLSISKLQKHRWSYFLQF